MVKSLLLCRHITRDDEQALRRVLSATQQTGREPPAEPKEAAAVVETLVEAIAHENLRAIDIKYAPSAIASEHASWLAQKLLSAGAAVSMETIQELDPSQRGTWAEEEKKLDNLLRDFTAAAKAAPVKAGDGERAVAVVGHMPQLGWLGFRLMSNRPLWMRLLDGYVTPLALKNGEVAKIALTGHRNGRVAGRLEWTVAPDEARAIDNLRNKIKSKMDIAKLLGGFITLVLGGVVLDPDRLDDLSRGGDRWAVYMAAVSFLIAIVLYVRTMYAYDSLLMPTRYWAESMPRARHPRWLVHRPPSSAAWILYQNMLFVWTFLFTPATIAVAVGLLALGYAALDPGWLAGMLTALAVMVVMTYALFWRRPILGSQD